MATLSLTVELAGFQHGDGVFHIKALAFACPRTRSSGSRVFDSTRIVPDSAAALRTFAYQTAHHGFPFHSTGLPPTSTGVVLQTFLQVTMLDWMEAGNAAPATLILWTKGLQKVHLFADLLHQIHFPELRIHIKNLEDLHCPPLTQLCPATQPWSICQKAVRLARWLAEQGLA